jgi:hypothetical protein
MENMTIGVVVPAVSWYHHLRRHPRKGNAEVGSGERELCNSVSFNTAKEDGVTVE